MGYGYCAGVTKHASERMGMMGRAFKNVMNIW